MIDEDLMKELQDGSFTPKKDAVTYDRETGLPVVPASAWEPEDHWDEHPVYTHEEWRFDVANGDTLRGYHSYVRHCLEMEKSE